MVLSWVVSTLSQWDKVKQPMSSIHLKVSLGCLLEDRMKIGGENLLGSRVLFRGVIGETPRELD